MMTTTKAQAIANEIMGTDEASMLVDAYKPVASFSSSSDKLVELELWTHHGEETELGYAVRLIIGGDS